MPTYRSRAGEVACCPRVALWRCLPAHERIDPASILGAVRKRMKSEGKDDSGKAGSPMMQMGLFSAAFENLPLRDAINN
jgi:adenine-specific DNA-methyltransferase